MAVHDIPDAELEVMACLWRQGRLSARQVREALSGFRPMTHAAVSTLLKRLEQKGLVTRQKGKTGKAFLYRAAVPPRRTYRRLLANLVERIFAGNGLALVSALFETHPPTPQQLEQLEQLLDKLRREHTKND
ncbi:MAG: BlaI/MecI/CopY family transcriptional regulator [Pirellulales bacterium]